MALETKVAVPRGRGGRGGDLDEPIADVHADDAAGISDPIGRDERGGAGPGGHVEHAVSGSHARPLDAADRILAQHGSPHLVIDGRREVPTLAHDLSVLCVRQPHDREGARFGGADR